MHNLKWPLCVTVIVLIFVLINSGISAQTRMPAEQKVLW